MQQELAAEINRTPTQAFGKKEVAEWMAVKVTYYFLISCNQYPKPSFPGRLWSFPHQGARSSLSELLPAFFSYRFGLRI